MSSSKQTGELATEIVIAIINNGSTSSVSHKERAKDAAEAYKIIYQTVRDPSQETEQ